MSHWLQSSLGFPLPQEEQEDSFHLYDRGEGMKRVGTFHMASPKPRTEFLSNHFWEDKVPLKPVTLYSEQGKFTNVIHATGMSEVFLICPEKIVVWNLILIYRHWGAELCSLFHPPLA